MIHYYPSDSYDTSLGEFALAFWPRAAWYRVKSAVGKPTNQEYVIAYGTRVKDGGSIGDVLRDAAEQRGVNDSGFKAVYRGNPAGAFYAGRVTVCYFPENKDTQSPWELAYQRNGGTPLPVRGGWKTAVVDFKTEGDARRAIAEAVSEYATMA